MKNIKLSILICTIPSRLDVIPDLIQRLNRDALGKPVEVIWLGDNKSMTVGAKRNHLISMATGEYIAFIDDDDWVSDNYIARTLEYIDQNPGTDCFTPAGTITRDGKHTQNYHFDLAHGRNYNRQGIAYRSPNHICIVKRNKVKNIPFPKKSLSEDNVWASKIRKELVSQVNMPDVHYYYQFSYNGTETQHTLKRIKKDA
jgi:glycosyltransferase involved in cell wall biosynthesis